MSARIHLHGNHDIPCESVALPVLRRPSAASPSLAFGSRCRFGIPSAGAAAMRVGTPRAPGRAIQAGAPAMRVGAAWAPGRAVQAGAPAMRLGTAAAVARAPGWAPGRAVQLGSTPMVGAPAMRVGTAAAVARHQEGRFNWGVLPWLVPLRCGPAATNRCAPWLREGLPALGPRLLSALGPRRLRVIYGTTLRSRRWQCQGR